jgi:hypothetical protein
LILRRNNFNEKHYLLPIVNPSEVKKKRFYARTEKKNDKQEIKMRVFSSLAGQHEVASRKTFRTLNISSLPAHTPSHLLL